MSAPDAEVVCLGEALVDLVSTRCGVRLDRAPAFRKAAGGAPANVAVGLARLGCRPAFLGALSADSLGVFLASTLARAGVDLTPTCRSRRPTALALVSLAADGDRDFLFYGDRPAHFDLSLTPRMCAAVRRARIFHFGSISLITEPARSATLAAIDEARRAGALVSYDPNLRLNLWPTPRAAYQAIRRTLPFADIVKVNEDELAFLTGTRGVARGLAAMAAMGPRLVVATLGAEGCAYRSSSGGGKVGGFPARVVDTTGAGDAFVAGLLCGLLSSPDDGTVSPAGAELEAVLTYANAAAALSTERRGGIPSLPTRRRVRAFLAANAR
jgi:fructokinase